MRLHTKQRIDLVVGSAAVACLRPVARVLGRLMRRAHDAVPRGEIGFIKMMGGGSLALAAPAVLGIRRRYPERRLVLITSRALRPFADALGVWDETIAVDDRSLGSLLTDAPRVILRLARCDTVVDLEAYSRLSTVLATLSCARNRLSFYVASTFWREHLATHLVFLNRFSLVGAAYAEVAHTLGATAATLSACGSHVAEHLAIPVAAYLPVGRITAPTRPRSVAIAPACSELAPERRLSIEQWLRVLPRLLPDGTAEVIVLGTRADNELAARLIAAARDAHPDVAWLNACDGRSLADSLQLLAGCSVLLTIDSALLHFARLFGIRVEAFWGPTAPHTRLEHAIAGEQHYYEKVICAPCVHVAETPPCRGSNQCMEAAVRLLEDPEGAVRFAASVRLPVLTRLQDR